MNSTVHRHPGAATGPADLRLPLAVVSALHTPAVRAPEVGPAPAARRGTRSRRATVRG
ncbi:MULTISPECIES: hypothetical protein [unclassified Streptomyces]|uniref:hypothetical protein n=1 Tax=unclassified Streptomyces TaxID=2593676 RepID=UPI0003730DB7|nr:MULTISPECIES: hypothetical protein [unclassified Streptomyces]